MRKDAHVAFEFSMLYEKGFDVMGKVFSGSVKYEDFNESSRRALQILINFIKNLETHEKSLEKVLKPVKDTADLKEIDIMVAIAEHLLGKLCPGESYFIDSKFNGKCECRCGCKADIKTKGTGIGNEHVWHGFLDVICESHGDISNGACIISPDKRARLDLEDAYSSEEEAETEVKPSSTPGGKNCYHIEAAIENQAATQAIVFSILQKTRHPEFDNFLIPFMIVSASHVRIFMYDAENDILIRCQDLPIFMDRSLSPVTYITLWMVLHYKKFCSGINLGNLSINLEKAKSGFEKHIAVCSKHYKALKSCVSSFPVVEEDKLIRSDAAINSASGFKTLNAFPPFVCPE